MTLTVKRTSTMNTSKMLTAALCTLTWLIAAGLGNAQVGKPNQPRQSRTIVHTREVSLAELSRKSKTIFSGKVDQVSTETIELGGGRSQEIKVVTFKVEQVKKGDLKPGDTAKFRLSPVLDVPIREGEELAWYLPKPSRLGLVAPVGIDSGFFRINTVKLPNNAAIKFAANLKNNQGLYPRDAPISPNEVRVAAGRLPGVDEPEKVIQSYANKAGEARPIPLSLLFVTTENLLKQ